MLEKVLQELSKETIPKKVDTQIGSMRNFVKRTKIWTVGKIKRHMKQLMVKGSKKSEWNQKAERKCKNLAKEILNIKKVKEDHIILTALLLQDKCSTIFNEGKLSLGLDRARVRIAAQPVLQKSVKEFYSKLSKEEITEVERFLTNRMKHAKIDHKFQKKGKNQQGNDSSKEETSDTEEFSDKVQLDNSRSKEKQTKAEKHSKTKTRKVLDDVAKTPSAKQKKIEKLPRPKVAKKDIEAKIEEESEESDEDGEVNLFQEKDEFWQNLNESDGEAEVDVASSPAPKAEASQPASKMAKIPSVREVVSTGELFLDPPDDDDEQDDDISSKPHFNIDFLADQEEDLPEVLTTPDKSKVPSIHKPQGHGEGMQGKESTQPRGFFKKGKFVSFNASKNNSDRKPFASHRRGTKRPAFQGQSRRDNTKKSRKF